MATRILIIGGGIGGMSAALGLQRAGFEVRVFEQVPGFAEVGAGITIGVTAARALDFLGVGDTVKSRSDFPVAPVVAHYRTGQPVAGSSADRSRPYDPSKDFHQIHRADLHAILADAVTSNDGEAIALGREFTEFSRDADRITARFADGATVAGDALIGCDGLRSRVRQQLFANENPRFTGQVAWRFLIPSDRVWPYLTQGASAHYMGPGRNFVRYLIRNRTLLNGVAFASTDQWTEEGWSIRSSRAELLEQFQGWNDDVLGLIRNAPEDGIFKWALFDRDPLEVWNVGRVALLGDAAHPMLPFLGLGAAMALEDSVLLARALQSESEIEAGLALYVAARKDRAAEILLASRKQGEIYNRVDPDTYMQTDRPAGRAALYAYDPAQVPLPPRG
jgi:salicylate hydroxylase